MSILGPFLLILAGLAIAAAGIFLFYAWLPLLYGLFGLEIGLLLGKWLTGDVGPIAVALGAMGGLTLFFATYALEPYRRVLLGISAGAAIGLAIASVFGLDHFIGSVLSVAAAVIGALVGANVVPRFFDAFIIVSSAFAGAGMIMAGVHALFPGAGIFDRSTGALLPSIATLALTLAGISWQFKNIARAVRATPLYGDISGSSVRDYRSE